ncbi:hypothetical protein [uncultured Gammaproteobacteria bacterium]|nr:hypothetical protein [uncultured Gammaproteobacteria bacterium]CAC9965702.1 hypothetical protein [uncultured Gammaproteobacteria bacterium]
MNNLNKKLYLWILIIFSIAVYLIIATFFPVSENNTLFEYLKFISIIATLDSLLIFLFVKYFWKFKYFYNKLVPFPNLNGTWRGKIKSTWIDTDTGKNLDSIPVILTIKQSFISISCVMRTAEMTSHSFSSGFIIKNEEQILKLVYSYDSNPKATIKERSARHFGTISFNIIINNKKIELDGEYWTARKTTGNVELEFWKKELISKYPNEMSKHPVSEK